MNEDLVRERLEAERTRLTTARRHLTERLAEDASRLAPLDRSESGPDLDQLEVALLVEEMFAVDLAAVDAAFARVDAGTYGICVACGSAIPDARLEAMPATWLCVRHEGRAEVDVAELPGARSTTPVAAACPGVRLVNPDGHGALSEVDLDADRVDDRPQEDAALHVEPALG